MTKTKMFALMMMMLGACGDDGGGKAAIDAPVAETPRETVMADKMLFVGDIAEGTFTGGAGDRAVIELTTTVPKLDFNIHGHANGQTQTVTEALDIDHTVYSFEPTADADWFLLLRNAHTDALAVTVKLELYGDIVWNGWE